MEGSDWQQCLNALQRDLPAREFDTWIRPLQAEFTADELRLFAPNQYVRDRVSSQHLERINDIVEEVLGDSCARVLVDVGSTDRGTAKDPGRSSRVRPATTAPAEAISSEDEAEDLIEERYRNLINPAFTFDSYVEGESNRLALAAAQTVASNPRQNAYNPLFIYGGSGLGKTHLIHAIANQVMQRNPSNVVIYVHAEVFVRNMVNAIRHGTTERFKEVYRSAHLLMIDDIHFLADKKGSQDEFFHTFNSVKDSGQQMILTCDKYPTEIDGIEERLKSRFSSGLPVGIEPPDLETRVAILQRKSEEDNIALPEEVAFFIAKYIQSNVRELEGVLARVILFARFRNTAITIDLVRESLKDVLAIHDRRVTIELIQRTVAEECNVVLKELVGKKRTRSVARPRQLAMALAREMTQHSLPEIGQAFGRDHTTVMHACKEIKKLREIDAGMGELYQVLRRKLTR